MLADRFDSPGLQQHYIADFVSLKFPSVRQPEAREAFCVEIDKAARRELDARRDEFEMVDAEDVPMEVDDDVDNNDASRGGGGERFARFVTPADVAVAFAKLKNRLTFLASVLEYTPAVQAEQVFGDARDIEAEFRGDVVAFQLLVKHCEPKADELVEEESLKEWCLRVDRLVGFFHDFQSLQLPESGEVSAIKDAIDRFQGFYSVLSSDFYP